jgi:hypothetical protein
MADGSTRRPRLLPWRNLEGVEVLLLCLAAIAGMTAMGVVADRLRRRTWVRHRLRKTPATPIAQVAARSVAKVVGHLRFIDEPLLAPLSGRRCAHYELFVDVWDSGEWRTLLHLRDSRDFLLVDTSGRARVQLPAPEVAALVDLSRSSGAGRRPTSELVAFLARHRIPAFQGGQPRELRYVEGCLEEGDEIAVLGWAEKEPDPDPSATSSYREIGQRVVFLHRDGQPLLVTDDPASCRAA